MLGDEPEKPNPYQSPAEIVLPPTVAQPAARIRRLSRKRLLLLAMLTVAAVGGLCIGWFARGATDLRVIGMLETLLLTGLTVQWCYEDSRGLGLRRWKHLAPLMVLCPGPWVMLPVYLLKTRGPWGLVAVLQAATFVLLLFAINIGTILLGVLLSGEGAF